MEKVMDTMIIHNFKTCNDWGERGREGKLGWKTSCMLPRILGRLYKKLGDQLFLTILAANSTSFSHIPSLFSIPDIVPRTSCFGKIDKP